MQIGIVGLPNAGKSTLFNALTHGHAQAASYPFSTVDPNLGRVALPDPYLEKLQKVFNAKKATPVTVSFVDIAGLVEGAHRGEGLGNQFLHHIRQVEALVHVLRAFEEADVARVNPEGSPETDRKIVEEELIQADLETIQKSREKLKSLLKTGEKKYIEEKEILEQAEDFLQQEKPLRQMKKNARQDEVLSRLHLLTEKPVLYVWNGPAEEEFSSYRDKIEREGEKVLAVDAQLEGELLQLEEDEALEMRDEMGIEPALESLISKAYSFLDLIKYYTGNENEVRARNLPRNSTLLEGAEKVHRDIAAGFIKGEVISAPDLIASGSWHQAREKGLIRAEGRDYIIQFEDVVYIHFR